jgi:hydroxyethylthiazole kinase-like uncharacterized protein yjeF
MKILTAAEMGEADRRTMEEFGVGIEVLMERAGGAVAAFCLRRYPDVGQVVAVCGKGNNGGDGLVAARVLAQAGWMVRVVLLGRMDEVKGAAAGALKRLRDEASSVRVDEVVDEVVDEAGLKVLVEGLGWAELVLDAVVGTGFKPPLRGLAVAVRDLVKGFAGPVVAVDVPSGWDADSMEQECEGAYRADAVVTFTAPKLAHVFGHLTAGTFGPVVVGEIGSPDAVVSSAAGLRWTGSAKVVAEAPRAVNANKGRFGHVLVVGGSYGKAGAPAMASLAALRAGAGLVTAAVPKSVLGMVAGVAPELMMVGLEEGGGGLDETHVPDAGHGAPSSGAEGVLVGNLAGAGFERLMKGIKVVAVGPGLGTGGEAAEFARELVRKVAIGTAAVPMVVDADALNAFEGRAELLDGRGRVMVLTPHPGEMARLVGMTVAEVEADRVGLARRFAVEHGVTLVLKGWRTLVAHPDGTVGVNTSGNPAMAKGGSGDILTGIVAAMLSQYPDDVARAVEAAVYLHGLGADFAVRKMDEHTVLATDTLGCLSDAFRYRVKDEDGLVWVCGLRGRPTTDLSGWHG